MKNFALLGLAFLMAPDLAAAVPANLYECSGIGVTVSYSTTSFTGEPMMTVEIGNKSFSGSGDAVQVQPTVLGNLVTIVRRSIPDLRTDTLTLVAPDVNIADVGEEVNFISWLVATRTRTTIAGPELVDGVVQSNIAWPLSCTATMVFF